MRQLVIGGIGSGEARLNQAKVLVRPPLQHLDLPWRRCHAKVTVRSECVYACMIAVAMREQQQADAREISRDLTDICEQIFRLHARPGVNQRIARIDNGASSAYWRRLAPGLQSSILRPNQPAATAAAINNAATIHKPCRRQ